MRRFMFTCSLCTMAGVLLLGADTPGNAPPKAVEIPVKVPVTAPAAETPPPPPKQDVPKQDAPKKAEATKATVTEKGMLKFNFRDVPLDTVLDYLSEAGGFTVVREATVEGRVDIVSHQPLNKDDAVALLNTVLNGRGFAAIRNERTLTIVKSEDAKQKDIPVHSGSNPSDIPKTGEMVTQVIPVRHADVTQLLENLKPLLPTYAVANANASSNAIVLTDTQTDVRRMTEIIQALDSSISAISDIKVFPLTYANATDAATMINSLFQVTTSGQTGANTQGNFFRFGGRNQGGPGGPGGPGGTPGAPGGGTQTASDSAAKQAGSRIQAVGDDRTNSVVVSAPSDTMPLITTVLEQIDKEGAPVAPIRVFALQFADATEMAQVVNDAFGQNAAGATSRQRSTTQTSGTRGGGQSARTSSSNTISAFAVADYRTNSIVVSAETKVMEQVEQMIEKLDNNPAKEQKVFIYKLKNADVTEVATVLQGMFPNSASSSSARRTTTSTTRSSSASTTNRSNSSNRSSSSASGR